MKPISDNAGAEQRAKDLALGLGTGRLGLAEIAAQLPALLEHRDLLAQALRRDVGESELLHELAQPSEANESRLWERIAAQLEPAATPPPVTNGRGLPKGVKVLPVPVPGWQSYLLSLDAETALPAHDHATEEVFVLLQGDVTDSGGQELAPGAVIEKAAGTHHDELHSLSGCLAWVLLRQS